MGRDNQSGQEEVEPGRHARVDVSLGPDSGRWGHLSGVVPGDQAPHLVTVGGIVASLGTGTAGAVFILQLGAGFAAAAYAELGLTLIAVVLIAVRGWAGLPARPARRAVPKDAGTKKRLQ
jgi:hypothetical protein